MKITDSLTLDASGLAMTRDGYLVGEAKVSRAGNVQEYYGSELGLTGDAASKVFGVYRDPDVVFDEKSMMSLAGRPVTRGHPPGEVNADNWRDLTVGQVGGVIRRDGEHVVAPMAIMDAIAAKEVEAGARALSAGYTVDVVPDEGITKDGTPYQFRQAGALRFNHVAYLPDNNPRAGNTRIGDDAGKWGASPVQPKGERSMTDANKQSLVVDGLTVSLDARDAEIVKRTIDNLTSKLADAEKAKEDMEKEKAKEDEEHEKDMAKKDAMIDELKGQVLDAAALDARVQARADLISTAKAIVGDSLEFKGKADAEIRKAVVTARLGDEAIAGKTEAYIDARFDILAEAAAKGDPIRDAARHNPAHVAVNANDAEAAHREYVDHINNAWKGDNKGAA